MTRGSTRTGTATRRTTRALPTGLTAEGIAVIESANAAGVELAGVSVMTMDHGGRADIPDWAYAAVFSGYGG